MKSSRAFKSAVARLKAELEQAKQRHDLDWDKVAVYRAEVLARYQPVFSPENVMKISEAEMREFLMFRNNRHWSGLQRMGPRIAESMPKLRKALKLLLDEEIPVEQRLNKLVPANGPALVHKLNRAVITPILTIAFPEKYGVWNTKSQNALKLLNIWPDFEGEKSFGKRYGKMNSLLLELATQVGVDLWTLDYLFHRVVVAERGIEVLDEEEFGEDTTAPQTAGAAQRFGLERYLQEFLRDNWEVTDLGKEWSLLEEDGELVGFEYSTGSLGRIDLLARHKKQKKWLVIELKRNQTSDDTVGQVLRYMGWVQNNLAGTNDEVHGLIIAREADAKLQSALVFTKNVSVRCYTVHFHLEDAR